MEHFRNSLKKDCEEILARFQASESVRFDEFTRVWREMRVSALFYGQMNPNEKRVFSRLVLSIASQYLFPPYTFQIRVGSLYLLYGLYDAQLVKPKEKIRLPLKDLAEVLKFQQDAVDAQHYDVAYIIRKLLSEKAFYFTAMPNPLCFRVKRKVTDETQHMSETFVDRPSRPQELISTDLLEELKNIHMHYEKTKQAISAQSDRHDLNLIKPNLVPKLCSAVFTYHSWQKNQDDSDSQNGECDRKDPGEGTSSQDESSRRAQLLASIKSKSFGQAVEVTKSRRHRQIELASDKTNEETETGLSLKARTQMKLVKEGKVSEELTSLTRLWRLTALENERTKDKKKRRFNWKSTNG